MEFQRTLNLTRLGWGLAVPVLFLGAVGLAAIHATDRPEPAGPGAAATPSASPTDAQGRLVALAERLLEDVGVLTLKQVLFFASGFVLLWLALRAGYQRVGRHAYLIYGVVIFLLLLLVIDRYVDLPLIPVRRNTRRWIGAGAFVVQPSEFGKLALVLALARYLRFRTSYRTWTGLIPPFLLTLGPMLLILKQPDLGTLLMLLPVLFVMLFVAGARMRHLVTIVVVGCATLPAFYLYGMQDYQKVRIDVVLKQDVQDEQWHMGPGYQLRQAKTALGLGGLTGEGYGQGAFVRYELLPEEHNDFIFAIVGNQWGLVGCALVILAYVAIVVVGMEVSTVTNDPFGRLVAVGVTVMVAAQAMLNMSMTIGLAPITGMPLPFVSAGGSSLWTNMAALGLLLSVAQRRPMLIAKTPFQHE